MTNDTNPIDWTQAPDWAQWATQLSLTDHWTYWYAEEPKPDGSWRSGAYSHDYSRDFSHDNERVVIVRRPQPTAPPEPDPPPVPCPDCNGNHSQQRADFPLGCRVRSKQSFQPEGYAVVRMGDTGTVIGHCPDGRAIVAFGERMETHVFCRPDTGLLVRQAFAVSLPPFPPGVRIEIECVFPGQYRIGYSYKIIHYLPGTPSYYPIQEAMDRCWAAFQERFPQD